MNNKKRPNPATIPPTTNDIIVFRFDYVLSKFDKNHYKPCMTNDLIQEEELNHFLRELEIKIHQQTKECDKVALFKRLCLVFVFTLILALVITLHSVGVIKGKLYNILLIVLLSFLGSSFLIFCFSFAHFFVKSKNLARDLSYQARAYVDEKGKEFLAKGLTWVIPSQYPSWIELWTDKLPQIDPKMRISKRLSTLQDEEKTKHRILCQSLSTHEQIDIEDSKRIHLNIEIPLRYKLSVRDENGDGGIVFDSPVISPNILNSSSVHFLKQSSKEH